MFYTVPPITRALLLINIGAFVVEMLAGDAVIAYFALWPIGTLTLTGGSAGFQPWQIVTYSFLHGSILHLAFNMFALWMFGSELERLFGPRRFLQLYFVSVITAALAQLVISGAMAAEPYPTIGASGGIFGLLLGYGMYFPNRMVMLILPPIPMPARYFVVIYGLLELYLGVTGTQEGVAHFAHLGGMLGAWLLIQNWRGRPPFRRR